MKRHSKNFKNWIGFRKGYLEIIEELPHTLRHYDYATMKVRHVRCKCHACGKIVDFPLSHVLYTRSVVSCGCKQYTSSFGDYLVLEEEIKRLSWPAYKINAYNCQIVTENWENLLHWYNHPKTHCEFATRIKYNGSDVLIMPLNTIISRRIMPAVIVKEKEIKEFAKYANSERDREEYAAYLSSLEFKSKGRF